MITLTQPTPNLLAQHRRLQGHGDRRAGERRGTTSPREPIGTGPFELTATAAGDSVELAATRTTGAAGRRSTASTSRFVPEPTVGADQPAERRGAVDRQRAAAAGRVAGGATTSSSRGVVAGATTGTSPLNQARPPFDDPRCARRSPMAIDREEITEAATFGRRRSTRRRSPRTASGSTTTRRTSSDTTRPRPARAGRRRRTLPIDFMVTNEYPETVTAAR